MHQTIAEFLRARAQESGDLPFIKCGGAWLSAAEVDRRSDAVAAGLADSGVTKGTRIALIVPNRVEYIDLFFACAKIGAVQIPLNIFLKGEFLRHQLVDSGAEFLAVDATGLQTVAGLLAATDITNVIMLDGDATQPEVSEQIEVIAFSDLLAAGSPPAIDGRSDDLFTVMYTSGTTGASKGCMLSDGYMTTSAVAFRDNNWIRPDERVITAFYLFHGSAQAVLMQVLTTPGCSVCFEPKFSASTILARARQERADILWSLGAMGMAILSRPESPDDRNTSLRYAAFPGMPGPRQEQFEKRFGIAVAGEVYGQSECLPMAISLVGDASGRGTMGRAAPHLDLRLVDDNDHEVPDGEIGEIVVRPHQADGMYSGYWNRPDATVQAWRNLWHHTGDLATKNPAGYLTFADRKKDSLRRRGENVSSLELEAVIARHPQVSEVAVCAVPATLGEDDIKACIVWHGEHAPSPEAWFEFFREHLPYFAIPRYVQLRESLPLTDASGRVRKHLLRDEGVTPDMLDLESLRTADRRLQTAGPGR